MRSTIIKCLVATVTLITVATGCSVSRDHGQAAKPTTRVAVCNAVDYAHTEMMQPNHLTFLKIVKADKPTKVNSAASAYMTLSLRADQAEDLGPYQPVIVYLIARIMHWTPEFAKEYPMPKRTSKVVESAKRLDRDLKESLCKVDKVAPAPATTR